MLIAGTNTLALLVENWGLKKFKFPDYAPLVLKNAQNTNPAAKNAAYEFYKAAYKWMGQALHP